MNRTRGLTLVELMIVVAIMAIIATVAYPLYTQQTQKARRAEAKTALQSLAMAQERFFTVNGRYATAAQLDDPDGDGSDDDSMIDPIIAKLDADGDGNPDNYALTITATTLSFSIDADAQGKQAGDSYCAKLSIDNLGQRTATDGGSTNCW